MSHHLIQFQKRDKSQSKQNMVIQNENVRYGIILPLFLNVILSILRHLVLRDDLKDYHLSIKHIYNVVRYVHSSPLRL